MDDKLRELYREHWLYTMSCDHEAGTDKAHCACGWTSPEMPNVGAAAQAHFDHLLSLEPPREAAQRKCECWTNPETGQLEQCALHEKERLATEPTPTKGGEPEKIICEACHGVGCGACHNGYVYFESTENAAPLREDLDVNTLRSALIRVLTDHGHASNRAPCDCGKHYDIYSSIRDLKTQHIFHQSELLLKEIAAHDAALRASVRLETLREAAEVALNCVHWYEGKGEEVGKYAAEEILMRGNMRLSDFTVKAASPNTDAAKETK